METVMRARMMVERPDDMEMTLKVGMTMKEWDVLRDQLHRLRDMGEGNPTTSLIFAINQMMTVARKVFYADDIDAMKEVEFEAPVTANRKG
jgi:hypothetical protein